MPSALYLRRNGKDTNLFGKKKKDDIKRGDITFVTFHYYRGLPY